MTDYIKLYEQQLKLERDTEKDLLESIERLDEFVLLAIGAALAAGTIFRIIDSLRGNKPGIRHYIKGLITWAFGEYTDGSLSINAIRKAAYETMREDQEIEDEFGPSSSKILSKKILSGLKKGSREFATILGNAIGRIAKSAGMSESELNSTLKEAL